MELATYVKGSNKHTNADVLDGCFFRGKEICVLFSSHFLWRLFLHFFRLGNWLEWIDAMHLPTQGGAVAGDDSQVFARFVGGASFEAWASIESNPYRDFV